MSILGHGVGEEVMEAVMEEDGGWFFKYKIALNRLQKITSIILIV